MIYLGSDPVGVNLAKATDVQINGASITTDGVANIPIAGNDDTTLGVVATNPIYGLNRNASGRMYIQKASDAQIKEGVKDFTPVVPLNQHNSVFYGLAKIAGADMASSSNNPGVYTDAAKIAIQKMLGIYEAPWELIREDTFTNADMANHVIDVDGNGQAFELTDAIMIFETPVQETYSEKANYGQLWFYYDAATSKYWASESGAWTQAATTAAHGIMAILRQEKGNLKSLAFTTVTTSSNRATINYRYGSGLLSSSTSQTLNLNEGPFTITKVTIPGVQGTGHYKLIGKRKWT